MFQFFRPTMKNITENWRKTRHLLAKFGTLEIRFMNISKIIWSNTHWFIVIPFDHRYIPSGRFLHIPFFPFLHIFFLLLVGNLKDDLHGGYMSLLRLSWIILQGGQQIRRNCQISDADLFSICKRFTNSRTMLPYTIENCTEPFNWPIREDYITNEFGSFPKEVTNMKDIHRYFYANYLYVDSFTQNYEHGSTYFPCQYSAM